MSAQGRGSKTETKLKDLKDPSPSPIVAQPIRVPGGCCARAVGWAVGARVPAHPRAMLLSS